MQKHEHFVQRNRTELCPRRAGIYRYVEYDQLVQRRRRAIDDMFRCHMDVGGDADKLVELCRYRRF